jgi:hypothetical protein
MNDRQLIQIVLLIVLFGLILSLIYRFDKDPACYSNPPNLFLSSHESTVIPIKKAVSSISRLEKSIDNPLLERIERAQKENRPVVWVYFEYEISARNWLNFYSRRSPQPMTGLLELCLMTIRRHFPKRSFEVIVYTQDDIVSLLPDRYSQEYVHMRTADVMPYLYKAFVRYALLDSYGGYSIPLDTIIMSSMEPTLADYQSGKCLIFGPTSTIYREWYGLDDTRMAAQSNNALIKEIVNYILENSRKFHYAMEFRDAIFRRVQQLVVAYSGQIRVSECLPTVNSNGRPYRIEDLYATSWTMPDPSTPLARYCMIPIHYDTTVRKYALGYLRRIPKEEIWQSELWIAEQIRRSLQ